MRAICDEPQVHYGNHAMNYNFKFESTKNPEYVCMYVMCLCANARILQYICWYVQKCRTSPFLLCSLSGGLGEAVCSAVVNESGFSVHRLAVSQVPRSGKPHELLQIFGIDRDAIIQAVRKVLSGASNAKWGRTGGGAPPVKVNSCLFVMMTTNA